MGRRVPGDGACNRSQNQGTCDQDVIGVCAGKQMDVLMLELAVRTGWGPPILELEYCPAGHSHHPGPHTEAEWTCRFWWDF